MLVQNMNEQQKERELERKLAIEKEEQLKKERELERKLAIDREEQLRLERELDRKRADERDQNMLKERERLLHEERKLLIEKEEKEKRDREERDQRLQEQFLKGSRELAEQVAHAQRHQVPSEECKEFSSRLQRAMGVLKDAIPVMTAQKDALPQYLAYVDVLFDKNKTDEDLRVTLLIPRLTDEARVKVQSLAPEQIDTYEKFKEALLHEFKYTRKQLRDNFYQASRKEDESCTQFVSRIRASLRYYLDSCKVSTFQKLTELMISDKIKDSIALPVKRYVADRERDGWSEPERLIELIDTYEDNQSLGKVNSDNTSGITCYFCKSVGHTKAQCYS